MKPLHLLGIAAAAGLGILLVTQKKEDAPPPPPVVPKAPIPKITNASEWTPPVGFPKLPAGFTMPAGAVPPGWIPPTGWTPPVTIPGWTPGQPLPGPIPPPPYAAPGTPLVEGLAPGPRGAEPSQRATVLGLDDGLPPAWSIPGVPSTTTLTPEATTATMSREMGEDEKVALWKTLFNFIGEWKDYCYEESPRCMGGHLVRGATLTGQAEPASYVISYQNDTEPPRGKYSNPGWAVLYSPSKGMFWLLEETPALSAATTDDWTLFLRPNEYRTVQARAGAGFQVPDSAGSEVVVKEGVQGFDPMMIPGIGVIPFPNIPGFPNPYPNGIPGLRTLGS